MKITIETEEENEDALALIYELIQLDLTDMPETSKYINKVSEIIHAFEKENYPMK